MRVDALRVRRRTLGDEVAAAALVGTTLMVVITVAISSVLALWLITMATAPEDPPRIEVSPSRIHNRWVIPVRDVDEERSIGNFRLIVRHANGTVARYDSDDDRVWDTDLSASLSWYRTDSADGPQHAPFVFLDVDGDGHVSAGDSFIGYGPYLAPENPLMDATRGYKRVSTGALSIPANSTLQLVGSETTLGNPDIHYGDSVKVVLSHLGTDYATVDGTVSGNAVFSGSSLVGASWPLGDYNAKFIVRPGAGDEWFQDVPFHVLAEAPVNGTLAAHYATLTNPLIEGDLVTLVHTPTDQVVLEFIL
jgi:hypothetical protein